MVVLLAVGLSLFLAVWMLSATVSAGRRTFENDSDEGDNEK